MLTFGATGFAVCCLELCLPICIAVCESSIELCDGYEINVLLFRFKSILLIRSLKYLPTILCLFLGIISRGGNYLWTSYTYSGSVMLCLSEGCYVLLICLIFVQLSPHCYYEDKTRLLTAVYFLPDVVVEVEVEQSLVLCVSRR